MRARKCTNRYRAWYMVFIAHEFMRCSTDAMPNANEVKARYCGLAKMTPSEFTFLHGVCYHYIFSSGFQPSLAGYCFRVDIPSQIDFSSSRLTRYALRTQKTMLAKPLGCPALTQELR